MIRQTRALLAALAASCMTLTLASAAGDSFLLRNATVHTMSPDAAGPLSATDVLVRDGRIAEIGRGLTAPAGMRVIEANGRPVTPGIFGGVGHVGVQEIGLEETTGDQSQRLGQIRPEFDVTLATTPIRWPSASTAPTARPSRWLHPQPQKKTSSLVSVPPSDSTDH